MRSLGASEPATKVRLRIRSAVPAPVVQPPVSRFLAAAGCFLLAAVAVAAVRAVVPFAHGWWLVAYLVLVGGVAQALLGAGAPLATTDHGQPVAANIGRWQLALWNAGTAAVAIFDVLGAPGGVLAGSVALVAALVLFAREAVGMGGSVDPPAPGRQEALFLSLIGFLAVSVVVGCYLAYALPGR